METEVEPNEASRRSIAEAKAIEETGAQFATIEELIAGMNAENAHPATDWGPDVGKEVVEYDEAAALQEEIDRLTDDLRGVHREYQADRYIRLTEKREAKIKQLEHMRAQQ